MLRRALVDLPVHPEGAVVEHLQAVHAHVARARRGIAGEDQGEGDEASGVTGPAAQDGQGGEAGIIRLHHVLAGRGAHPLGTRLGDVEKIAELLELVEEGAGHAQIEKLGHAGGEIVEALHPEGRRHARGRAEGIDQHRHIEALDIFEEERLIAVGRAFADAVRDLGDLEIARDGGADAPELPVLLEVTDEGAEILEGHRGYS